MLAAIERKVEGQEITLAESESPKAQVIDLMDALKASLGDSKTTKRKPAKKSARSSKSSRKKTTRKKVAKKG